MQVHVSSPVIIKSHITAPKDKCCSLLITVCCPCSCCNIDYHRVSLCLRLQTVTATGFRYGSDDDWPGLPSLTATTPANAAAPAVAQLTRDVTSADLTSDRSAPGRSARLPHRGPLLVGPAASTAGRSGFLHCRLLGPDWTRSKHHAYYQYHCGEQVWCVQGTERGSWSSRAAAVGESWELWAQDYKEKHKLNSKQVSDSAC